MKKGNLCLFVLLIFISGSVAAQGEEQIFAGQLMDSHCAMLGSHDATLSELRESGEADANSVDCTRYCIFNRTAEHDKYVLFTTDEEIYDVEFGSQRRHQWGGENVKVVGRLDDSTNTVHIRAIYPEYWEPDGSQ